MTDLLDPMHRCLLAILAAVLSVPTASNAQARGELEVRGGSETIGVRDVATLSFVGMDVAPDALARVFPLPGGGWSVGSDVFGGILYRFDSAGRPLSPVGTAGEGPGELKRPAFSIPVGETLWVIDPGNVRLSVFDASPSVTAERRLPGRVFSASPSAEGTSVLIAGFLHDGTSQYAVARIGLDDRNDVFGGVVDPRGNPRAQVRQVAETRDGEVWAVATSGGVIDILRGTDLTLLERRLVPGKEFTQEAPQRLNMTRDRPVPQVAGIAADSSGLVWLAAVVADRNWAPGLNPSDGIERLLDTRVLAIDPTERAVVAQIQLDGLCFPVDGSRISCVNELHEEVRILELILDRPRG